MPAKDKMLTVRCLKRVLLINQNLVRWCRPLSLREPKTSQSSGAEDFSSSGVEDISSLGAEDVSSSGAEDFSSSGAEDFSSSGAEDLFGGSRRFLNLQEPKILNLQSMKISQSSKHEDLSYTLYFSDDKVYL
ncbi:hypothetical protein L6452_08843 [Arctium lappa]|uniref:Uncharacterized protein n=1 Tax=Arctium lappa TaxID=4217 RepID=A0ACB9DJ09_ARCLA|nr:hypothetical protein L6452_08843 [Arctium lappa]